LRIQKYSAKDAKTVIPASLQKHAVAWYCHYLQHPGTFISRKLFVSQFIGKVYKRQSNHTSKNIIVVR
jgi:hypothetical protein